MYYQASSHSNSYNPLVDTGYSFGLDEKSSTKKNSSRNPLLRELSQYSPIQENSFAKFLESVSPKKRRLPSTTPPHKQCLHVPEEIKKKHWIKQTSQITKNSVSEVNETNQSQINKEETKALKRLPSPTPPIRGLGLKLNQSLDLRRSSSVTELARHRVESLRRTSTPMRERKVHWGEQIESLAHRSTQRSQSAPKSGSILKTDSSFQRELFTNKAQQKNVQKPEEKSNQASQKSQNIVESFHPALHTSLQNTSQSNGYSSNQSKLSDSYVKIHLTEEELSITPSKQTLKKLTELNVEQAEIVSWITQDLGIELPQIVGSLENPMIADPRTDLGMSDGVLLAKIVGKLENTVIRGIDHKPTKNAAMINNLNKSLEILRNRKNMNPTYLWSMKEISSGNYEYIWGLLYDIYQEYGKTFRMKYKQRRDAHKLRLENILLKSSIKLGKSKNKLLENSSDSPLRSSSRSKINLTNVHSTSSALEKDLDLSNPEELCNPRMEREARAWLHQINFDTWLSSEHEFQQSTLQDVLRNGVFLCKLMSNLEMKKIQVIGQPLVLAQAIQNVENALQILREKNTNIPKIYLHNSQRIVQGDKKMFWGLIYHIMKLYPQSRSNYEKHYSGRTRSIYPAEDMHKLELSILYWLHSLGLLNNEKICSSIEDVNPEINNGLILCSLCEIMNGSPLQGVFDKPRVNATKLSNITKSLEFLRRQKGMATTFLFSENEILNGEKNTILGLFEDIHRCYDKQPPKIQHDTKKGDRGKPYLGKGITVAMLQDFFSNNHLSSHEGMSLAIQKSNSDLYKQDPKLVEYLFGSQSKLDQSFDKTKTFGQTRKRNTNPLLEGSFDHDNPGIRSSTLPVPATPPTEYRVNMPTPSDHDATVEQRTLPEPFFPSSYFSNALIPSPSQLNASVNALYQSGINTLTGPQNSQNLQRHQNSISNGISISKSNLALSQTTNMQRADVNRPSQGFLLGKWLESIGIRLKSPFSLEGPSVHIFSDGLLLCEIVGKLNHSEIKGVTQKPQARAACLHNIKKALSVLRKRKNMPIELLWSEEEIYKGNGDVIRQLLEQIRNAYHHHIQ